MESQRNSNPASRKTARLEVRINPELKERLEFAATLTGVTPTDFVIASVIESANRAIEQYHQIRLSERDARSFVDSLLNPDRPSPQLRKAAHRYRKRTGK